MAGRGRGHCCLVAVCLLALACGTGRQAQGSRVIGSTRRGVDAIPSESESDVELGPRGWPSAPLVGEGEPVLGAAKFDNDSDKGDVTFSDEAALGAYYFATATYCPVSDIERWDSGRKVAQHPRFGDVTVFNATVRWLWGLEEAPLLVFTGYDADVDQIVVSFMGTKADSYSSWFNDFQFYMSAVPKSWGWLLNDGAALEDGFLWSWEILRRPVHEEVARIREAHPKSGVTVVGHSFGGALATVCAADLRVKGLEVDRVFTFGQPRVGNLRWAMFYNHELGLRERTFRVVNRFDPVPHLPSFTPFVFGYYHVGVEVWLGGMGYSWTQCNDVDLRDCPYNPLCHYNEDLNCSMSTTLCLTSACIHDHVRYFNVISDDKFSTEGC